MQFRSTQRTTIQTVPFCKTSNGNVFLSSTVPYFDPIRMLIIDPMHILVLLSIIFNKVWIYTTYCKRKPKLIVVLIASLYHRLCFSRIPSPTDYSLTAEQWMLWVNYYSIYCMHGILTEDEMECWRSFVLASRLLSPSSISNENVALADTLLLSFCRRFENLHGSPSITPNIHMHGHLTDCVRDFGPLSSFWLFSFERFNGLLGNLPTNNRSIEVQVMRRNVHDNFY